MASAQKLVLNDAQKEDLRRAFKESYDLRKEGGVGDGVLDIIELARAFELLGLSVNVPILRNLLGGKTALNVDEFIAAVENNFQLGVFNKKTYERLFQSFDSDNSKTVNSREFIRGMKALGVNLTRQEARELINKVDTNGDKVLSLEEFSALMELLVANKEDRFHFNWRQCITTAEQVARDYGQKRRPPTNYDLWETYTGKVVAFVRHGESQANVDKEDYYRYEPGLTDLGVTQCFRSHKVFESSLAKRNLQLLVVSPLHRTIQTSQIVFASFYMAKADDVEAKWPNSKIVGLHTAVEQVTASDDIGTDRKNLEYFHGLIDWSALPTNDVWYYVPQDVIPKGKTYETLTTDEVRVIYKEKQGWIEPWHLTVKRALELEAWLKARKELRIGVVSHGDLLLALTGFDFANAQVFSLAI